MTEEPLSSNHQRPSSWLLYGAVAFAVLLWTLNAPVGKVGFRHIPPVLFFTLRTAGAALLMGAVVLAKGLSLRSIAPEDRLPLGALMLFGHVANQFCYIVGLSRTSVAHSAIIYSTLPITILLLAVAIGQEQLRKQRLLGMLVSALGVVILGFDRGSRIPGASPTLIGDLLTFAASAGFASVTVFGRRFRERYDAILMTAVAYIIGAIVFVPLLLRLAADFDFAAVPLEGWAALIFMSAGSAVTSYLLYFWALGYVEASRVATAQYFQPPVAALVAASFLGEPITTVLLVGGAVVLTGVFMAERG